MSPDPKDVVIEAPFTGSAGSSAMTTSGAQLEWTARQEGDIVVDLPRWTELVQTAYRNYNAAIVANLLAVRN